MYQKKYVKKITIFSLYLLKYRVVCDIINMIEQNVISKIYFNLFFERMVRKMKITICIGSSCHIKGSHQVVERLQALISENGLEDRVSLGGTFCMGKCQQGVCVRVDENFHSVTPDTVNDFFEREVKAKA